MHAMQLKAEILQIELLIYSKTDSCTNSKSILLIEVKAVN